MGAENRVKDPNSEKSQKSEKQNKEIQKQAIGKISQSKKEASTEKSKDDIIDIEMSYLNSLVKFLSLHGIRKSKAAVREAVETRHSGFAPKEALEAVSKLGFKCSYGNIKLDKFKDKFYPVLAFKLSGEAFLILGPSNNKDFDFLVYNFYNDGKAIEISASELSKEYSGYSIITKKMTAEEVKEQTGHWFFSSFRSSKWLYIQVGIAAMVSNFLSLATSIFTMTVYDRIIPNAAIESLVAMSIGVIIAVGFDFIIKSLRGKFIDIASKKADLEISGKLYDKILGLSQKTKPKKTGALANTVREFENLREFFNSSTLVVLIDLPFVFFFIYVIYLLAGPMAYVSLVAVPTVIIVGLGIQPLLSRITKGSVESGMNKQAVLVETLNGLETISATGSGKLMKQRYSEALVGQSETTNKIRGLSMFVVNFAASVQQFAQVGSVFVGVFLIIDGTISQGALIATIILSSRAMAPLGLLAQTLSRMNGALAAYRNLNDLMTNMSPLATWRHQ